MIGDGPHPMLDGSDEHDTGPLIDPADGVDRGRKRDSLGVMAAWCVAVIVLLVAVVGLMS